MNFKLKFSGTISKELHKCSVKLDWDFNRASCDSYFLNYLLISEPLHFGHPKCHLKYPNCCNILSKFQELDPVSFLYSQGFPLTLPIRYLPIFLTILKTGKGFKIKSTILLVFSSTPWGGKNGVWAVLSSSEESSQSCVPAHILSTELESSPRWAFCNWDFLKKCQFTKPTPISMTFGLGKVFQVLEFEQPTANTPFKNKNIGGFTWWGFFTAIHKFVSLYE